MTTTWETALTASGRILLILAIALLVRFLLRRAITRLVTRLGRESERRRQRAETIGSVLRSASSVALLGTAGMMALSEVGVQLGPLVASAGIVGVALGFGARNVVMDILSGMFMLLEDQYGVGDRIDVGEATGTVLEIGMRVTTLRGDNGEVWYVRNGEIKRVGNLSQGWATASLDVEVAPDTDLARVRKTITVSALELSRTSPFDELLWEPLESPVEVLGLDAVSSDAMVVKVVAKTQPGKALVVERELRWRVKLALEAAGIEPPLPTRGAEVSGPGAR
ncbi:mechanosensitive ion channel family protein [Streptomyces sp. 4N509B]|uniref:mechanosensitive ion channel family protein n=1 Tax=Streptomyces sp. 4N509B TaxID=3457413 RepID=UPI003FD46EE7